MVGLAGLKPVVSGKSVGFIYFSLHPPPTIKGWIDQAKESHRTLGILPHPVNIAESMGSPKSCEANKTPQHGPPGTLSLSGGTQGV